MLGDVHAHPAVYRPVRCDRLRRPRSPRSDLRWPRQGRGLQFCLRQYNELRRLPQPRRFCEQLLFAIGIPLMRDQLQCCNDAHPFAAHQRPVPTFPQTGDWNWPSSMDEAWCHSCVTPDAKLAGQQPSAAPSMVSVRETNQFLEALSMNSTPSSQGTSHHPVSPHLSAPQQFDPSASLNFGCEWGNCQSSFNSLPHLIDHLNYDHLQINAQAGPSLHEQQQHQQYPHTLDLLPSSEISCQWHHCREPAYHMATPAALYNHLMNEHLKSLANTLSSMDSDQTLTNPYPTSPVESPTSIRRQPSQEQIRLPEPVAEDHKLKLVSSESPTNSRHPCRWKDCNLEFDSYDSLTTHINSNHIGGGKAHYECFWEGCSRNGQQGFQSKQKICRHVQVSVARFPGNSSHSPFSLTLAIGRSNVLFATRTSQRRPPFSNTSGVTRKRVSLDSRDRRSLTDHLIRAVCLRLPWVWKIFRHYWRFDHSQTDTQRR